MNNWAVVDWTKDVWHFVVRMLIAIICGLAIGFERKSRSKEAGIRTHAIVCLASCLFMILSKYLTVPIFSDITGGTFNSDATRIAAQVVTGIGFLGAGIIMYRRDVMHGLTTAAGDVGNRHGNRWRICCDGRCCNGDDTAFATHLPSPHQSFYDKTYRSCKNANLG